MSEPRDSHPRFRTDFPAILIRVGREDEPPEEGTARMLRSLGIGAGAAALAATSAAGSASASGGSTVGAAAAGSVVQGASLGPASAGVGAVVVGAAKTSVLAQVAGPTAATLAAKWFLLGAMAATGVVGTGWHARSRLLGSPSAARSTPRSSGNLLQPTPAAPQNRQRLPPPAAIASSVDLTLATPQRPSQEALTGSPRGGPPQGLPSGLTAGASLDLPEGRTARAEAAVPAPVARPPSQAAPSGPAEATPSASNWGAISSASDSALQRELRSIEPVRAAVARADGARAWALLQEHESRFPDGALRLELEVLRLQTMVLRGEHKEASIRARAMLQTNPHTAYQEILRDLVESAQSPSARDHEPRLRP